MRIGLYTGDLNRTNADNLFAKIARYGFESAQLSFASVTEANFEPTGQIEIPAEIDGEVVSLINQSAKKYNIEIVACSGTFNMAHPDYTVPDEGIKRYEV